MDHGSKRHQTLRFFKNKFKEQWVSRPTLINQRIRSISMMDAICLEALITLEEIKSVVWACGSDKAPEPDGFTLKIIKKY